MYKVPFGDKNKIHRKIWKSLLFVLCALCIDLLCFYRNNFSNKKYLICFSCYVPIGVDNSENLGKIENFLDPLVKPGQVLLKVVFT